MANPTDALAPNDDPEAYQGDLAAVQKSAKDFTHLSIEDLGEIARLHVKGLNQRKIADIIGCSQPSVSYALRRMAGSTQEVQAVLKARVQNAVQQWDRATEVAAKRGDHRPARELIEAAYPELRPQPAHSAGGVGVTVIVGMPGAPIALPTLNAAPAGANTFAVRASLSPVNECD